jgi:class 3 adenylate cyclase
MTDTHRRGLRSRLARSLVGVALVSVLLLSGVNYVFARLLISDTVESQVIALRDTRIDAFERGFARLNATVSILATNPSVVDALVELSAEYRLIDEDITDEQTVALESLYESEVLPPFVAAGVDIDAATLVPTSTAGRYLQQHYIAENGAGFDDRAALDDAGDGSGYSAAHAVHHPLLRQLLENAQLADLLLVDLESREVVYSTGKRIDLGTNVVDGPYVDTGLAEVVDRLSGVALGDTTASDSWFYVPTRGEPVFFLAAAVRSGAEVVGALVMEVPVSVVTAVTTADGDFGTLGLGETGEVYVVGRDRTLRSESRRWVEDPEGYLDAYRDRFDDEEMADLIGIVGSPVLLQTVDNEAVTVGLEGDEFVGIVTSYLGTETLAAAGPARVGNLGWVVVAEFATSESDAALDSYVRRMLVVLAILLPVIAGVGFLLARNLSRPVKALVGSAQRIANGDLDTEIIDFGRNEIGDVGRQLEAVAQELDRRRQAALDEERTINEMLVAVLPERLVERVRAGEQNIVDILDTATIISLGVDGIPEATGADQDIVLEITERLVAETDDLMAHHGIERIQRSTASGLFVAGLDHDDARTADAARFALAAVEMVASIGAEFGQPMIAHAGLAAGDVATGLLGSGQVAFGIWGDPPGVAVTLDSMAQPGQVLADSNVVDQLGREWDVSLVGELPGLSDDIEAHAIGGEIS